MAHTQRPASTSENTPSYPEFSHREPAAHKPSPSELTLPALLLTAQRNLAPYEKLLRELAEVFQENGHMLYLVGGSVRDALLGRGVHDLDFTTDARPERIAALLEPIAETVWDTGIEFGTVSGMVHGETVEITTFRADTYDGKSRNPQVKFGDSIAGDLIRRDFAVNALALALDKDGRHDFCDPLGGMNQLITQTLDTPDDPAISFHDDPLRMLRACRFASQLGFTIAPRVRTAMTKMAGEIQRITTERIKQELDKLILGADPARGFDLMVETGLAQILIPEIPAMQMTQDEHMQHKDVYAHSLQVLRQAIDRETDGPDLVLRWAALLHDCGKPSTRAAKPGGGVTFYHHDVVGAKMARKRLRQLKFSKQEVQDISGLIYLHQRFHGYAESAWNDSAVRRYVTDAGPLLEQLHKLVRADCTTRNQRKAARLQRLYDDLERRIAELKAQEDLDKIRPDLDGNEIMQILDIPAGPVVGRAWKYLKELRLDNGPMEREDAILALKQWWVDQGE